MRINRRQWLQSNPKSSTDHPLYITGACNINSLGRNVWHLFNYWDIMVRDQTRGSFDGIFILDTLCVL